MQKLKPCPFCGKPAEYGEHRDPDDDCAWVQCSDCSMCSASGPPEEKERIISEWNNRPSESVLESSLLEIARTAITNGDNEGTRLPWWLIIDPRQNFNTDNQGLHNIAGMITGPFLSRESAENFLKATRYNFGKGARVFCHSGHNSMDYENLQTKARNLFAQLDKKA